MNSTNPSEMDPQSLYDRQVIFFRAFETSNASAFSINKRLQESRVIIVGLGGYGTWIALLCSRIGIRHIIGFDPDRVELSNLNRQVLYTTKDIGDLKIEATKRALSHVDDNVHFEGHPVWIQSEEDLLPYREGVDLVFNPFGYVPVTEADSFPVGFVARAALHANLPCLISGGSWIGPLTIPRETACYWCLSAHNEINEEINAYREISKVRGLSSGERLRGGAFAPRVALAGALAVWEASRFLSGIDKTPALKSIATIDTFRYTKQDLIAVDRDPRCERCGTAPRQLLAQ
jgi:bacteriocin biosynthesis cyclodehydratase domain-containing protein